MTARRILLRSMLVDLFFFTALYVPVAFALHIIFKSPDYSLWLLLLLPVCLIMSIIRLKINILSLFILAQLTLAMLPLLLPSDWIFKIAASIMLLGYAVYSFVLRIKRDSELSIGVWITSLGLLALFSALGSYFSHDILPELNAFLALILTIGFFLYRQTKAVDDSLGIILKTARQPTKTILKFNNRIIGVFLAIMLVFALLSSLLPAYEALSGVGTLLLAAIRAIFSLFNFEGGGDDPVYTKPPALSVGGPIDYSMPGDNAPWLTAILNGLFYIAATAALIFVLGLIVNSFYKIYKAFYSENRKTVLEGDTVEYIGVAEKHNSSIDGGFLRSIFPKKQTEKDKIRREYKKRILWHKRRGVDVTSPDTTGEIAQKVSQKENITELTDKYNKARYSDK